MTVNNNTSPLTFIKSRLVRLFPVFWLSMLFSTLMVIILNVDVLKVNLFEFIINLTMIPSAFNVKQVDGVYWTLKIEWFFYLSILLLLFLKKIDKIINIIIFLIVIIFIISIVYKAHPYFQYSMLFICGINFFLIWKNQAKIINHLIIFSTILLAGISGKLEYFVVSCILISIMYLLVNNKLLFLNFKPFIFFGKISYAFYLIHQNFGHSIQIRLLEHGVVNIFVLILLPFSLSVFISYFITYFFEKPVARILKARI